MGACVYCGKPAGWFRDRHDECVAAAAAARKPYETLKNDVYQLIYGKIDIDEFIKVYNAIPEHLSFEKGSKRRFVMEGFNQGLI